jgi:type I restriction enzyme S subunit
MRCWPERVCTDVPGVPFRRTRWRSRSFSGFCKRSYCIRIHSFHVALPPIREQRRIVAKLGALSTCSKRARGELDRILDLVERCAKAILTNAFTGQLTEDWRSANGVTDADEAELGSVARDFTYGSAAKSMSSGTVPVLRMRNIQDGKLDWTDLVFTSDPQEIQKYKLSSGDVLFNRTNSPELVGKTAIYRGERPAIYAGYLIRIRCGDRLDPEYLTYCLNSPHGREYCWRLKTDGVSQSNINAKKLAAFRLRLLSIEEQREIVRRIEAAFAKLDRLAAEARSAATLLDRLDQAVMAKAFRGELVPQDPNDEPASVLLERIRAGRATRGKPAARRRRLPRMSTGASR